MNMDDRDKAGDQDSNPEIEETDSEESMSAQEPPKPKHNALTKLKTFYLENFKDPEDDNSIMIDKVTHDMGHRLSKTMQDY